MEQLELDLDGDLDRVVVWPDGTWCMLEDLEEMTHMSDDFRIVPVISWCEDGEPVYE